MKFDLSIFTGNKFCLFNFATQEIDGYVDFDWFRTGMAPIDDRLVVWLEAECGSVGSMWHVASDTSASNSSYAMIQPGSNDTLNAPTNDEAYIVFPFSTKQIRAYYLNARVLSAAGKDGSFWIKMDNGSWAEWDNLNSDSWEWKQFPTRFNLRPGDHTLTLAYRQEGIKLDKIYLAVNTDIPTGIGESAENLCTITSVEDNEFVLPSNFELQQNYPNPFNPVTTIKYSIPFIGTRQAVSVQLKVYDMLGREIATLVDGVKAPGNYQVKFDGSKLASGVYLYRMQTGKFKNTKKFVLLK